MGATPRNTWSLDHGRVAQLDRVSASEAEGRGSESRLVHHSEAIEMQVSMAFSFSSSSALLLAGRDAWGKSRIRTRLWLLKSSEKNAILIVIMELALTADWEAFLRRMGER